MKAFVASIQVGKSREFSDDEGKVWQSSIIKAAIASPAHVSRTNILGDEQADCKHHGGLDKAVLAYSAEHYAHWRTEFPEFEAADKLGGAFGENLTIRGLTESEVCIGDIYAVGSTELQVSQPRQPCWKLSHRWGIPKLAVRVQETGRTGWYFRVHKTGDIDDGDELTLTSRAHPEWTVEKANSVMFAKPRVPRADDELARCPALSESWSKQLYARSGRD